MASLNPVGQHIPQLPVRIQELHVLKARLHILLGRGGVYGDQRALLCTARHIRPDKPNQFDIESDDLRVRPPLISGPRGAGAYRVPQRIGHIVGCGGVRIDISQFVPAMQAAELLHVGFIFPHGNDLRAIRGPRPVIGDHKVVAHNPFVGLEHPQRSTAGQIKRVFCGMILLVHLQQRFQLGKGHLLRQRNALFPFIVIAVDSEKHLRPQVLEHWNAVDPAVQRTDVPPGIDSGIQGRRLRLNQIGKVIIVPQLSVAVKIVVPVTGEDHVIILTGIQIKADLAARLHQQIDRYAYLLRADGVCALQNVLQGGRSIPAVGIRPPDQVHRFLRTGKDTQRQQRHQDENHRNNCGKPFHDHILLHLFVRMPIKLR